MLIITEQLAMALNNWRTCEDSLKGSWWITQYVVHGAKERLSSKCFEVLNWILLAACIYIPTSTAAIIIMIA